MALKCIQFTDGTQLALYASPTGSSPVPWDDNITFGDVVENFSLENAFITAGNPNGGYVNPELSGKEFTDKDGNKWAFSLVNNVMKATITKKDGTIVTKDLFRTYSSQWDCRMWYICCRGVDESGKYKICWGEKRPATSMSRKTTGAVGQTLYINGGYVDGVSGEYNFTTDAALINPENGYRNSKLRNLVSNSSFVNVAGITLGGITPQTQTANVYYSSPYSSGNEEVSPFLTLSENAISDLVEDTDPYGPGGESGRGGGTGNFDGTGDDIDIPGLPTLSAVDTGFITLFNPSIGQLQSLANYMWSSGFDLDTFKKLFADPMDCILGLSIVPVAVPNGGSKAVSVGNISTGISMTIAASQYVEVDCGTLNVNEYWGAYLDYDPYTKAEIYLPYIGTHPLAVDDIMGKPVRVVYHIDILSGACTAFVKCGGSVLYEFIGQCSSSIPITGNDWTNVINGVLTVAGAIGSMVATGGASAPMAAGVIAATATNSMKPNVEKSGSMSGTGGMLAVQVPYLILTRPRQALPSRQNSFMGYPSFITESLGSLSGYTEIESVHLDGINATEQELSEIETLLKSGVIF